MKINLTPKLSYKDVYITPKPSELKSRAEVNLEVSYIGKHSKSRIHGIPVIVANMSCVGTIEMAQALAPSKIMVALHKFIPVNDLIKFFNTEESKYSFYTIGTKDEELEQLKFIKKNTEHLNRVNLDVANGYLYQFLDRIKLVRELFPHCIISAGNVCTPEGVENIVKAGADIAKCGISNGCFIAGTNVKTINGNKKIEKVKIGEQVLTHTGEYKTVSQIHQRLENQRIIDINGIQCTPNHKFYVVHKNDSKNLNENNIHLLAKWVSAEELSDDYFLIKITE